MTPLVAGAVGAAYATAVIGIHRGSVWYRRQRGQGYRSLGWLDWNCLLQGLIPPSTSSESREALPSEGGTTPALLSRAPALENRDRYEALADLVRGTEVTEKRLVHLGFVDAELRWAHWLSDFRAHPRLVAAQLEEAGLKDLQSVYLFEWLQLNHFVNLVNLEWSVFRCKWRLSKALNAIGQHAGLFLLRAQASSMLGQNTAMVDDLARAVFFSKEDRLYLEIVNALPMIEEERPAFARVCQNSLERFTQGDDV